MKLLCKRICKPNTARRNEAVATSAAAVDHPPRVDRDQRGDLRLAEPTETGIVRLITQRRQASDRDQASTFRTAFKGARAGPGLAAAAG